MIRHVVLYTYKDTCTKQEIEKVYKDLDIISARLPGRVGYSWGTNNTTASQTKGYTHCLVADFEDTAARDLFLTDPERAALSKNEVIPRMVDGANSFISFDFEWND